jgi:hypothetical protein
MGWMSYALRLSVAATRQGSEAHNPWDVTNETPNLEWMRDRKFLMEFHFYPCLVLEQAYLILLQSPQPSELSMPCMQDPVQAVRLDGSRSTAPGAAKPHRSQRQVSRRRPLSPLSCTFHAKWIQRARRIFANQHFDVRYLVARRHRIVGKACRKRLALSIVDKLFEQSSADTLRHAACNLALDQHGIDDQSHIIGHQISFDNDAAGQRLRTRSGIMDGAKQEPRGSTWIAKHRKISFLPGSNVEAVSRVVPCAVDR